MQLQSILVFTLVVGSGLAMPGQRLSPKPGVTTQYQINIGPIDLSSNHRANLDEPHSKGEFRCPASDGMFGDPNMCPSPLFFTCEGGDWNRKACPPPKMYAGTTPDFQPVCVWPTTIQCPRPYEPSKDLADRYQPTTTDPLKRVKLLTSDGHDNKKLDDDDDYDGPGICPEKDGYYAGPSKTCPDVQFFECRNTWPIQAYCPPGFVYSGETERDAYGRPPCVPEFMQLKCPYPHRLKRVDEDL